MIEAVDFEKAVCIEDPFKAPPVPGHSQIAEQLP
jgi:hypothetical protein